MRRCGSDRIHGFLAVQETITIGVGLRETCHPRIGVIVVAGGRGLTQRRVPERVQEDAGGFRLVVNQVYITTAGRCVIQRSGDRIHGRQRTIILNGIRLIVTQDRVQAVEDFKVVIHTIQITVGIERRSGRERRIAREVVRGKIHFVHNGKTQDRAL